MLFEAKDPNDPLQKCVKPDKHNPLVVGNKDVDCTAFCDPTIVWWGKDGHWRMLVGSVRKQGGITYLSIPRVVGVRGSDLTFT